MNEFTRQLIALALIGVGFLIGGEFIKVYMFHGPRGKRKPSKRSLKNFGWNFFRFLVGASFAVAGMFMLMIKPS